MKAWKLKALWGAGITGAIVVGVLHLQSVTQAAPGNASNASKVQICHFPPGNPANIQLITISANALAAHLAHGDMTDLEACQQTCGQLKCDDGNVCTIDTCDANNQCIPVADRPLINCDDSKSCTADSCDAVAGCVNTPSEGQACDDGLGCTQADTCTAEGACVGEAIAGCCTPETAAEACNDDSLCTDDLCVDNRCENRPTEEALSCDDGNACTVKSCDPFTGACVTADVVCNDGDACTIDECDPVSGCTTTPVDCNDGNACTTDSCDSASGCVHQDISASCNDGDVCTGLESCDPSSGCQNGTPLNCEDDGNVCTAESCDPATGCQSNPVADGTTCDDDDACTIEDACQGGTCVSTPLDPGLDAAAITKQITAIDASSLTIEIVTLTTQPFKLTAVGLLFPPGFTLGSLSTTSCTTSGVNQYRCRHLAVLHPTTACQGDGAYQMSLNYSCDPAVSGCSLCEGSEVVNFTLNTENFCDTTEVPGE